MPIENKVYRIAIKERFIQAVELVCKEVYPQKKEVDIIKSLGFSPPNFYRMRISDNSYPTLDNCYLLCNLYNISEEWLLSGKSSMKAIGDLSQHPIELLKTITSIIESDYQHFSKKK